MLRFLFMARNDSDSDRDPPEVPEGSEAPTAEAVEAYPAVAADDQPRAPERADQPTVGEIVEILRTRGDSTLDLVADCGAVLGPGGEEATTIAAQRAVDACLVLRQRPKVIIKVGVGNPRFNDMVIEDADNVVWRGEGPERTTFSTAGGFTGTLFMNGFQRVPRFGQALPSTVFVPLDGKLDQTAGERWGLDLSQNRSITAAASPLCWGNDFWKDATTLGAEFAIEARKVPALGGSGMALFGCVERNVASPYWVRVYQVGGSLGNTINVGIRTDDGITRQFFFPYPSDTAMHRVMFHVDLDTAKTWAAVDGIEVRRRTWRGSTGSWVDPDDGWMGDGWRPGLRLWSDTAAIARIGALGEQSGNIGAFEDITGHGDFLLCGLRLAHRPIYARDGVGTPARRLDGKPVTDASTYFSDATGSLAWLPLSDRPEDAANRKVRVNHRGTAWSRALFLDQSHANVASNVGRVDYEDLAITGAQTGDCIGYLNLLYGQFRHCNIEHAGRGIGSWRGVTSYTLDVVNCWMGGRDAAIDAYQDIISVTDCRVNAHGRSTFRMGKAGAFSFRNFFSANQGRPDFVLDLRDNATAVLDWFLCDIEDATYPRKAGIRAEAGGHYGVAGLLMARGLHFGSLPTGVPLIRLDEGPGKTMAEVDVTGVQVFHSPGGLVALQTQGPRWGGKVKLMQSGRHVHSGSAAPNVTLEAMPPTAPNP